MYNLYILKFQFFFADKFRLDQMIFVQYPRVVHIPSFFSSS